MIKAGRFIVVEGLEGAGKSTAIETIKTFLQNLGHPVCITREPGGTALGEQLRSLMKSVSLGEPIQPLAELLMMYAARVQLVEQVIKPALQRGDWVISDRFELSSFAYQGGGRELGMNTIEALSALCLQGFTPDLILYLDVSLKQGFQRASLRGQFDRFEEESHAFFERVSAAYANKIQSMKNVRQIDASQTLDEVQASIRYQLNLFLQQHHDNHAFK